MSTSAELIPTAEAAEILGVTPATVNRWAVEGKLSPAHQLPGLRGPRLYHRRDVERLARQLAAAKKRKPNGAAA